MNLFGLPQWIEYLIAGGMICIMIASAAIILARAGRSVGWSLLLLLPWVQIALVWVFAFSGWPREDGETKTD